MVFDSCRSGYAVLVLFGPLRRSPTSLGAGLVAAVMGVSVWRDLMFVHAQGRNRLFGHELWATCLEV